MNEETARLAELLGTLSNLPGSPAFEEAVAEEVIHRLTPIATFERDRLGSVIARLNKYQHGPKVALFAHMDEVAFMVKEVTEEGYIKILPLGGWWSHVLPGKRVIVHSQKGTYPGILAIEWDERTKTAEDQKKTVDLANIYVDVGTSVGFDVHTLGIRPGDPVVPESRFTRLANPDLVMGKAFDDRVGLTMMIRILQSLHEQGCPNTPIGVATVGEEVGLIGAGTSSWLVDPDIAIILETSYASDTPASKSHPGRKVGKGPFLNLADRMMMAHPKLRQIVIDCAETLEIPLQFPTSESSATDGAKVHISRSGVPTVYCGVVARGIHSHHAVVSLTDMALAVKLFTAVVQKLGQIP